MTADLVRLSATAVEFTGARGGESPLSWGQLAIWRLTRWLDDDDPYFNMPWVLPIYGRRDLDTVLGALRVLVERHETLRTTYEETPGGLVQRVAREGRFTVEVYDAGEVKPTAAAKELSTRLAATAFDYATELPFRCAVVTVGGRPRAVALTLSHLAVDGGALDVLARDWRDLLAGGEPPAPTWQPMDQAAFECEGPGAARGERTLRHWRAVLERAPLSMFDFPRTTPEEPRFVKVGMESAATAAAAEVLAARWSVSTASVLTTASAVLLGTLTGHDEVVMQLIVANRHDPRVAAMVGSAVQDGIFILGLPEGTFTDAARAGHRQALTAYRNAHYNPYRMMALREEVGRERGRPVDLSAYFNDARTVGHWPHLPAVEPPGDPAAIAALTERTRTFHVGSWPEVDATAMFATGTATNTCELFLMADTAYLPRPAAYALLRGVESLLVASVARDVPLDEVAELCGIVPVERPAVQGQNGSSAGSPGTGQVRSPDTSACR